MQILVLNGVNLDVIGRRDPALYGGLSLNELERRVYEWAHALDISARCRQSNSEGEFIEWIHDAYADVDAVIVNPGAWSHYSYAIRDALDAAGLPGQFHPSYTRMVPAHHIVELRLIGCPDPDAEIAMIARIDEARGLGDTVGGVLSTTHE